MAKDQYYLKCRPYYKRLFKREYSIKFSPYNKGHDDNDLCNAKREDVFIADPKKNNGLVRITLISVKGDKARIGINDSDEKESRFYVNKKDILKNRSAADNFRNSPPGKYVKYMLKNPLAIHDAKKLSQFIIR